jgi:hypothetical protein
MLTPERQFEIAASTMSREQLYELAKRQAVEIARLRDSVPEDWRDLHDLWFSERKAVIKLERELAEARERLEQFAAGYHCGCAHRYPGSTEYHGHDCENEVVQEFVAQFLAAKKD